ncbi:MAG: dTDP-4-dehydrorhamnose 3,5-epimerase, partial [Saprospiraceae bacterium]|nr:dTDP-4-dehydrorhamnose 3,5-epimerase [Saprospiraceae bacterium]
MNIIETEIEGLFIVEPQVWTDDRGYFFETYQAQRYSEHGIRCQFIQDNEAFSLKGALRGLHYQLPPYGQAKLVRVISGMVQDVAVDIRPASPTFGKHVSVMLSEENKKQFFVPAGFAHGYLTLSE